MGRLRKILAVWVARLANFACKIIGMQGVTLAGKLALIICPNILKDLSKEIINSTFVVCGTNGKTTTNNILTSIIESNGLRVVSNRSGSNMLNGVVSAYVLAARLDGKLRADYACIEVDEASAVHVFPAIKPDYMVLTNLFRDQLDRYGEIDITMRLLEKAMASVCDMTLIVNADDSLSTFLSTQNLIAWISFGIRDEYKKTGGNVDEIREGRFCKACGSELNYEFYHYGQLGSYACPTCGFKRPDLTYAAVNLQTNPQLSFDILFSKTSNNLQESQTNIKMNYAGFYNIYNVLAAYAAAHSTGINMSNLNEVLAAYAPENGRMERFIIDSTEVILNLAKNPTGFNQNIFALLEDDMDKDIIILINDNAQDGRDVSWLWDVEFNLLRRKDISSISVCGTRANDMRLRLKYEDIDSELFMETKKAICMNIAKKRKKIYVLVNYTGLYSTHKLLSKMQKGRQT